MGKHTEQIRGTQPPCSNCENLKAKLAEVQEQFDTYRTDHHDSMADLFAAEQRAEKAEARVTILETALINLKPYIDNPSAWDSYSENVSEAISQAVAVADEEVKRFTPTCKSVQKRLAIQKAKPELTEEERRMMRHALGLDRSKNAYRNGYCVTAGSPSNAICADLATRGMMAFVKHRDDLVYYSVTPAGRSVIEEVEGE